MATNCDECSHFAPWPDRNETAPDSYNPCEMRHRMSFRYPTGPSDQNWGFYRDGCGDRQAGGVARLPTLVADHLVPPPRTPNWSKQSGDM